jgi:hypothetical protein
MPRVERFGNGSDEILPPNLIDKWEHGSTDGEIFVSIRDGVGGPGATKGLNGLASDRLRCGRW